MANLALTQQMVTIYANLIRKGFKTIDDIPKEIREEVKTVLGEE